MKVREIYQLVSTIVAVETIIAFSLNEEASPANWVNIAKKKRAILGFKNTIKNPDTKFPNKELDI